MPSIFCNVWHHFYEKRGTEKMDMTQYFNQYNQYHTIPHNYIFLIGSILIITYVIVKCISIKHDLENCFALFCTLVMFCFIMFVAAGFDCYENHFVVKPFIRDVQSEINEKLNVKITYQQTEKLLEEQPLWANHLTKKDLDDKH